MNRDEILPAGNGLIFVIQGRCADAFADWDLVLRTTDLGAVQRRWRELQAVDEAGHDTFQVLVERWDDRIGQYRYFRVMSRMCPRPEAGERPGAAPPVRW